MQAPCPYRGAVHFPCYLLNCPQLQKKVKPNKQFQARKIGLSCRSCCLWRCKWVLDRSVPTCKNGAEAIFAADQEDFWYRNQSKCAQSFQLYLSLWCKQLARTSVQNIHTFPLRYYVVTKILLVYTAQWSEFSWGFAQNVERNRHWYEL